MFVLAHLSDPHLAPLPLPTLHELMGKRVTGFLHWRHSRHLVHRADVLARVVSDLKASAPDHIAVTGDLVNIALAAEFAPARAWMESLGPPPDVTLVPGNHDAYVRAAAAHPQAHWGNYMRGDDGGTFPFLRRRRDVALIGLSSAVPTAPLLGTGRLGSAQLEAFSSLLERCGQEGLFRVVLIHHPPRSAPRRHFKRLVDADRFRAALARYGAELVIHGHDHTHSLSYVEGPQRPIPVAGVPSASQIARPGHDAAGYNLYRIGGKPGAWHCEIDARGLTPDGASLTRLSLATASPEPRPAQMAPF